jgi:flagellar motor switch protein FliN/FliY
MAPVDKIEVELTVLVGEAELTLRQLLRKGRGAVISLGRNERKPLEILANGRKIAEGRVILRGDEVAVELTDSGKAAAA